MVAFELIPQSMPNIEGQKDLSSQEDQGFEQWVQPSNGAEPSTVTLKQKKTMHHDAQAPFFTEPEKLKGI